MTRCDCNGMEFICNRWVFTGCCPHTRERAVQERMALLRRLGIVKEK